ncbi:MAG: hypothetical protein WCW26_03885 [Candidatus Buchananbacteria bacterium]
MKKFIYWLPRVLAVGFILFLSLFALDVFDIQAPWYLLLGGFLMHLIPSFVLIVVTIIAWKKPLWGGLIFIGATLVMGFWLNWPVMSLVVILPPALLGGLFLLQDYYFKKSMKK